MYLRQRAAVLGLVTVMVVGLVSWWAVGSERSTTLLGQFGPPQPMSDPGGMSMSSSSNMYGCNGHECDPGGMADAACTSQGKTCQLYPSQSCFICVGGSSSSASGGACAGAPPACGGTTTPAAPKCCNNNWACVFGDDCSCYCQGGMPSMGCGIAFSENPCAPTGQSSSSSSVASSASSSVPPSSSSAASSGSSSSSSVCVSFLPDCNNANLNTLPAGAACPKNCTNMLTCVNNQENCAAGLSCVSGICRAPSSSSNSSSSRSSSSSACPTDGLYTYPLPPGCTCGVYAYDSHHCLYCDDSWGIVCGSSQSSSSSRSAVACTTSADCAQQFPTTQCGVRGPGDCVYKTGECLGNGLGQTYCAQITWGCLCPSSGSSSSGSSGSSGSSQSSSPTHLACAGYSCLITSGPGANTCTNNPDCVPSNEHLACQNFECTVVTGAGNDTCATNPDCVPPTSHLACAGFSCLITSGPGANTCTNNPDCIPPNEHLACVNNSCTVVAGMGNDTCATNPDCVPPTNHLACAGFSCLITSGPGANTCTNNPDCVPPTAHLACVSNACTVVPGAGNDTCATNPDCIPPDKHLACVSNACTVVNGVGSDLCASNPDCIPPDKHLACVSNACTVVNGAGNDTCATNPDCTASSAPSSSSVSSSSNSSNSSATACTSDFDCGPIPNCPIDAQGRFCCAMPHCDLSLHLCGTVMTGNACSSQSSQSSGQSSSSTASNASTSFVGRYAYVTNDGKNTFQVIDIQNPNAPVIVNSVATGTAPARIAGTSAYVYVLNQQDNTMQTFDIADPRSPVSVGTTFAGNLPYDLFIQGNYIYVVHQAGGSADMRVFDISNPRSPQNVATVPAGTQARVFAQDQYVYVVSKQDSTLQIFDVSNPRAPASVATVPTGYSPEHIFVRGSYAYVGSTGAYSIGGQQFGGPVLQIFDVGNPRSPVLATTLPSVFGGTGLDAQGTYLYYLQYSGGTPGYAPGGGVEVIDIADPRAPVSVKKLDMQYSPWSFAIAGQYMYVGMGNNSFYVYDITDPRSPVKKGGFMSALLSLPSDIFVTDRTGGGGSSGGNSQSSAVSSGGSSGSTGPGYCCVANTCYTSVSCVLTQNQCQANCGANSSGGSQGSSGSVASQPSVCFGDECSHGGDAFCQAIGQSCIATAQLPCLMCGNAASSTGSNGSTGSTGSTGGNGSSGSNGALFLGEPSTNGTPDHNAAPDGVTLQTGASTSFGYCCFNQLCIAAISCPLTENQCLQTCAPPLLASQGSLDGSNTTLSPYACLGDECARGGTDFCKSLGQLCEQSSALPCARCIDIPTSSSPFTLTPSPLTPSPTSASFLSLHLPPVLFASSSSVKTTTTMSPPTVAAEQETVIALPSTTLLSEVPAPIVSPTAMIGSTEFPSTLYGPFHAEVAPNSFAMLDGKVMYGTNRPPTNTSSGPETLAIMVAGASAGYGWMRRRRS